MEGKPLVAPGSRDELGALGGPSLLATERLELTRPQRALKRAVDIVGAVLGLVVLAPLAILAAAAIKLDSPGPVFFRQRRVGRDGRTFQMIKFRTMVDGAHDQRPRLMALNEADGLFKLTRDPRVTRTGRLLRRRWLDELPQLIHVLRGEMSLVGPRPLVVEEDRAVRRRDRNRVDMTPGMTGPWQLLGPTRASLSEMVKLDYLYAVNWSLWNDTKIILKTFVLVAAGRGV